MGTPIVITGDTAEFPANCCSGATTGPISVPISGTGKATVGGKAICLVGDEAKVIVPSFPYFTSASPTPGTVKISIQALDQPQNSQAAFSGPPRKAAILATSKFTVLMTVVAPATNPAGAPDPLAMFTGKGEFKTSNQKASAGK
jgi:hypothetical protein